MITLDIFSDPVCPWCYIGKTNLERALESAPDHPFAVEWHPFQLNPDLPAEGAALADYLESRFGGKMQAARAMAQVTERAAEAGVEIDFTRVSRLPNTLNAHRLIHWAGLEGRQTPMVSALFRAYWRDSRDIGDTATLTAIAGEVGMDSAVVARLLGTDADAQDLLARDRHARARGVTAVPTFLIGNQYVVSGAQPPQVWADVIAELCAGAQNPKP